MDACAMIVGIAIGLACATDVHAEGPRFRFGIGGGGGGLVETRASNKILTPYNCCAWVISVPEIRLGVQVTRVFGSYLELRPQLVTLGFVPTARLLFAAVLLDHLEFAMGPGVGALLPFGGSATTANDPSRTIFTPIIRASVVIGPRHPITGVRKGLGLSASAAPFFGNDENGWILTTGISYEIY